MDRRIAMMEEAARHAPYVAELRYWQKQVDKARFFLEEATRRMRLSINTDRDAYAVIVAEAETELARIKTEQPTDPFPRKVPS